jgi:hypothetical protein
LVSVVRAGLRDALASHDGNPPRGQTGAT